MTDNTTPFDSEESEPLTEFQKKRKAHWELIAHTNFFLNSGRPYGDWLYPLCPPTLISVSKGVGRQYYSDEEIEKMSTLDLYPIKQDLELQRACDCNPMNQPPRIYGRGNYASDLDQFGKPHK